MKPLVLIPLVILTMLLYGCTRVAPGGGYAPNRDAINATGDAIKAGIDASAPYNPYAVPLKDLASAGVALALAVSTVVANLQSRTKSQALRTLAAADTNEGAIAAAPSPSVAATIAAHTV